VSGRAAFPFAIDGGGHTACADGDEAVREMLEQILFVAPGERVNRPDFGCHIQSLTFAARTNELTTAVQALVEGALRKWAGDAIHLREVKVGVQEDLVVVTVRYVEPRTQRLRQVTISN
jgi:phage baseplate assembly protein W